jgi:hypothetical protein
MPPLCEEKQKFRPFFFVATDPARERERTCFFSCRRKRGNLPERERKSAGDQRRNLREREREGLRWRENEI